MSSAKHEERSAISAALTSTDADLAHALRQAAEAQSPPNIEGFEILRFLSHGGQGLVYEAVQLATKRKVAIKVLIDGRYASSTAQKRFEREIELVAQLRHPNIVAVFHSGLTTDGLRFCAMDYVRGVPLHRFIREQDVSLEEALATFAIVRDAAQHAHQRGIIHRDLKPANILVDAERQPRVLDFGLAKWLCAPIETIISRSEQIIGTLQYMSPEQIRGNPEEIDSRADIYSLGVMLYLLLTGEFPYPVAGQVADVLRHIAETPPTPPAKKWTPESGIARRGSHSGTHDVARGRARRCPIDDDLRTIVLKTLAKERERRYQSAGELARDLRHYLAGEPIDAKRDSLAYVLRKKLLRHKTRVLAAVLGVLLLGAAAWGWFASQAAEQARLASQRQTWLAALRAARLDQRPLAEPGEAAREAIEQLWALVDRQAADPVERLELVAAALEPELEERTWTRLTDVARGDGDFLISFALHAGWLPAGYALEVHLEPTFDGLHVRSHDRPYHIANTGTNGFIAYVDELPVGSHVLAGRVQVYFAWQTTAADGTARTYQRIDETPVELPILPFAFTTVNAYPADYPFEIVDEPYAARFTEQVRVLQFGLIRARTLRAGSMDEHDALRLTVSIPAPPCELALRIKISAPDIGFDHSRLVALRAAQPAGPPALIGPDTADAYVERVGPAWLLTIDVPATRMLPSRTPEDFRDHAATIEIVAAREAALQPDMNVNQYVRVGTMLPVRVGEFRSVSQRAAAAAVYPRLEALILPERVRAALDADATLSAELRAVANEILDDLDQPNVLMSQAREVVHRSDAAPAEYAAALLRATAADAVEPDDGANLQVLGIAQYRVGAYADAVVTLSRSLAVEPYDTAVDWAFLALALDRLGRRAEALAALDEARDWLSRAPHGPEFRTAFVNEAERVLHADGVGPP